MGTKQLTFGRIFKPENKKKSYQENLKRINKIGNGKNFKKSIIQAQLRGEYGK